MKQNVTCKGCGGSGQTSFFKGVSRFLISCEECPECAGLGYVPGDGSDEDAKHKTDRSRSKESK